MGNPVRAVRAWLADSLRYRGVPGTVAAGFRGLFQPILGDQRVINFRERVFDRRFGVITAGVIPHERMKIGGPSATHATFYQAAQPVLVDETVGRLAIAFPDYTFVDFGCGKGKALLVASSYPFERMIGLELSPELAEIARANVAKYRSRRQRCRAIEVRCADAVDFELPPKPLVCFLYNPFGEAVLEKVLDNVGRSLREHPRDLFVVYLYPLHDRLLRDRSFLVSLRSRAWGSIYRSLPAPAAGPAFA